MNKRNIRKPLFCIAFIMYLLCISNNVLALNEETHKKLNSVIAVDSGKALSLDEYLKNNLNFEKGVDEVIPRYEETISKRIELGGLYEDDRPVPLISARSYMHFHDPTKQLDDAGFKGDIEGILKKEWDSSLKWALDPDLQSGINLGDYSWTAVREYFYQALIATNKDVREDYYADTFRGIGQLMHLVEDSSVPLHVRNEGHPSGFHYEVWVHSVQNDALFDDLIANPVDVYSTVLSKPGMSEFDGNPISRLFDTENYDGTNPGVTVGIDIGMAEYTNANFFSRKTATDYDYPAKADMYEVLKKIPNPAYPGDDADEYIYRHYNSKYGDGLPVEYLACVSYEKVKMDKYEVREFYDKYIFLDEACYKNYASKLLPRAVGYASALMQYFIRGQIEAIDAKTVKASLLDGTEVITGMTLKVKNNTTGEAMSGGNLVVSYSYDMDGATHYGKSAEVALRADIPTGNGTSDDTFKYEFSFDPAIPTGAQKIQYMLVYKGKLGAEEGAVAAKSFKETFDWTYLYIIQKPFILGSVGIDTVVDAATKTYAETLITNYTGSGQNNVNGYFEYKFDFDLEWAGRWDTITNVTVTTNMGSFNLKTQDASHKLDVRYPTPSEPIGGISIYIKQPGAYWEYIYGVTVAVDTIDDKGKKITYKEPVVYSLNWQLRDAYRIAGSKQYGYWYKEVYFFSNLAGIYAAFLTTPYNTEDVAVFYIDGLELFNNYTETPCSRLTDKFDQYFSRVKWYVSLCYPLNDSGAFLPPFSYSTATAYVHRRWLDKTRNGVRLTNLKTWTIPLEYWRLDE